MAGDADKSHDEMVVRIAILEGIVFALIEERARAAAEASGVQALAPRIAAAVNERPAHMPGDEGRGERCS